MGTEIKDIGKPLYQALMVMIRNWCEYNKIDKLQTDTLQAICYLIFDQVFDFGDKND